ncbi:HET-domain-containing protein [Tothia fuscella]|uniref:HET-domain-containing protein n=1 Tax=Tothia fuscella TaxID=1048955 RepID=A0A9P4U0V3_9PEZI|nr:HET-domain-containing protein [Tothia fuscella]
MSYDRTRREPIVRSRSSSTINDLLQPDTHDSRKQLVAHARSTRPRGFVYEERLRPDFLPHPSRSFVYDKKLRPGFPPSPARRASPSQHSPRPCSYASTSSADEDEYLYRPRQPRRLSLWNTPQEERDRRSRLCSSCKKIDFESYLEKKVKWPIKFGRLGNLDQDCPFCRLVIACVHQSGVRVAKGNQLMLCNELNWKLSVVYALYDGKMLEGYSTYRDVRATAKRTGGKSAYSFVVYVRKDEPLGDIQYLADNDPLREQRFFGRRVDQNYIDLELVRSWLPRCKSVHGRSCEESGEAAKRLPNIRVVDVLERLVVSPPPDCVYVALSYVWGKDTDCKHVKTRKTDVRRDREGREYVKLPSKLPQTIEDAMFVTKKIGMRYLWVDALCIIQDSEQDKHAQVLRMDGIYSSATLTIAAASGNHANVGLAGISTPRRIAQKSELVNGKRFALPLPDYMSLESDPSLIWNSRGWTFQEKVLSKRLLLFTDYQVYFQCSNMVWCEDIALETDRCSGSTKKKWRPLRWAGDRHIGENERDVIDVDLDNYVSVIEQFTPRTLGDRKDGVDAIEGVLGTLQSAMGSFECGLPQTYFGPALLWQPRLGSIAARIDQNIAPFPSWSWARWQLSEGCTWTTSHLRDTYLAHVVFLISPDPREKFPLAVHQVELQAPAIGPQPERLFASKKKYITSMPRNAIVPTPALTNSDRRLIYKIGCALYFQTQLVKGIRLGSLLRPINRSRDHDPSEEMTSCQYQLEDHKSHIIGDIEMSAALRHTLGKTYLSFVVVCWSKGYNGPIISSEYIPQKKVSDNYTGPKMVNQLRSAYPVANIMLVRWVGNIAERIAVGNIVEPAWKKFKEASKWIVLG